MSRECPAVRNYFFRRKDLENFKNYEKNKLMCLWYFLATNITVQLASNIITQMIRSIANYPKLPPTFAQHLLLHLSRSAGRLHATEGWTLQLQSQSITARQTVCPCQIRTNQSKQYREGLPKNQAILRCSCSAFLSVWKCHWACQPKLATNHVHLCP